MKNKICLTGFKGEELESLRAALSSVSSAWDSIFVPEGAAALELLSVGPFDAVVASMRMEGMNGAELLQKVGERCPKALRFIVSDVADQAFIIDCISGTHQFIARPFKASDLASTIQRSMALDAWLSNDQLRALAPKLHRLPSLPATYFDVLKQLESPSATLENVGTVIARDPAATARLLQVVNSTAFALERKVTDPIDAVCLLGMETVKSLLLCMQVFSDSDETKRAGVSLEELWRHSFNVGQLARKLTTLETKNVGLANDAFTAGLLHDVGRIVLASNLPNEYGEAVASAQKSGRPLHEEELKRFGVTHAQVGAYLLGLWGLPAGLVESAALHHSPGKSSSIDFTLLTAVHVANVFALEHSRAGAGFAATELDLGYLNALGLANKVDAWRRALSGEEPGEQVAASAVTASAPPAPTQAPAPMAYHQVERPRTNWLVKLLIPAAAMSIVGVGSVLWLGPSKSGEGALPVRAKVVPQPESAATKVPAESAPLAVVTEERGAAASAVPPGNATTNPAVSDAAANSVEHQAITRASTLKTGFDSVKVQGVFYNANNPSVIINGRTLEPGERINDVTVVSIGPSSVTLSFGGVKKAFQVK